MSNASTSTSPIPESLVFATYHQPTLKAGNYEIRVEHTFHTHDQSTIPPHTFLAKRRFRVEGERFQLKPDDIQAVFPPQGQSRGPQQRPPPHPLDSQHVSLGAQSRQQ